MREASIDFRNATVADLWSIMALGMSDVPEQAIECMRSTFYAGFDGALHCIMHCAGLSEKDSEERFAAFFREINVYKASRP